jgi:hypothetical protein
MNRQIQQNYPNHVGRIASDPSSCHLSCFRAFVIQTLWLRCASAGHALAATSNRSALRFTLAPLVLPFCTALTLVVAGCGPSCDDANLCPVVVPHHEDVSPRGPMDAEFAHQIHMVADGRSREIDVPDAELADEDVARLDTLTTLEAIKLPRAAISDAGVAHLARFDNLDTLVLGSTSITDQGLALLAQLPRLRVLNMAAADVTSAGLASLVTLDRLELLRLGSSRVDDAGLAHLARMPTLKFLIIENAPITDGGIQQLAVIAGLESLYVEGTKVTDAGVADLQKRLPNLHVHW